MVAKADGNAVRTERTRSRILAASLQLFNDEGEARVGTAAIAAEAGISPGNLYYHFRGKDRIVEALFTAFEERVDLRPVPAGGGPEALENLWLYLHLVLEAVWDFRFLYRGLDGIVASDPRLRRRFARVLDGQFQVIAGLAEGLAAGGALRARPGEIAALARNALIVATYWLGFRALRGVPGSDDPGAGAFQVMSLFAPYLVGDARRHFERLGRRYVD